MKLLNGLEIIELPASYGSSYTYIICLFGFGSAPKRFETNSGPRDLAEMIILPLWMDQLASKPKNMKRHVGPTCSHYITIIIVSSLLISITLIINPKQDLALNKTTPHKGFSFSNKRKREDIDERRKQIILRRTKKNHFRVITIFSTNCTNLRASPPHPTVQI